MNIGDIVTFKQYASTFSLYRRRLTRRGTVKQITGDDLTIEVEGAPPYGNRVAIPAHKATIVKSQGASKP